MSSPVRVGIIGSTSKVARLAVIPAIERSANCAVVATASLSDAGATHASYEALVEDTAVEAVYIPLPNSLHRQWTEHAARAGKHVLCEKPLAHCTSDALAMGDACSAAGVVLMEAYMTHFHPRDRRIAELARSGRIGEFLFASTSFTGVLDRPDDHRWRPEMGGGALLDVGIYCITPMLEAAAIDPGSTDGVRQALGVARRGALGVDASFAGWLDFGGGRSGSFQCSFEAPERQLLEIVGTAAALSVERAFTPGPDDREISLRNRDGSIELVTTEGADPYLLMVEHFGAVVRGQAAPERTVAESIALQRLVARLASTAAAAPV